jgi:predicted ATPase/class 3 adenylate cyclase
MLSLQGYDVGRVIHEGVATDVYHAVRKSDHSPVVLKALKASYPMVFGTARLRHEFEILSQLHIPGVVLGYDFVTGSGVSAIVLEEFSGDTLRSAITSSPCDIPSFLRIALQLADAVGGIHAHEVIHKDIKPEHVLYNPVTAEVKLIDFSIATQLSRENPTIEHPNAIEGSLAYMSPEQTGRMNRVVDYRTDFYSLGITLYELLVGWFPFQATDPMELIHSHIARMPVAPFEIRSEIPEALSDIVMKLLAKRAEDRYSSAAGLRADLEECLRQWETSSKIERFELGRSDVADTFDISHKLYGRTEEIDALMTAFHRVSGGATELILVSGEPGIGKSSLVNEIHRPIAQARGYFVSGKFNQFKQNIPYAPLIEAIRDLIRQVLAESEESLRKLRDALLVALGPNGSLISDVIPEAALVIGEQHRVPELPPAESQNRFNLVFQAFVRTIAAEKHPLVVFLDDLQWSDAASLKLIARLVSDPESHSLLVIGAYRDNEVTPLHPLMLTVKELEEQGSSTGTIHLGTLKAGDVAQLIIDTFRCQSSEAAALAATVYEKTAGNPFFVIEFLRTLHQDGLVQFDRTMSEWRWNNEEIRLQGITDNVVTLMSGKIRKLTESTQRALILAACIGGTFDLATLSLVHGSSQVLTAADLWDAIREGLVIPIGGAYKFVHDIVQDGPHHQPSASSNIRYRFSHDRVQQAAYSLIPEDRLAKTHLEIGRCLLRALDGEEPDERIFMIVNQMNAGAHLITEEEERSTLIRHNLMAGRRAKGSNAYEPAIRYLKHGVDRLTAGDWRNHHELARDLHVALAECEYLTGDFGLAREHLGVAMQNAVDSLEKAGLLHRQSELLLYIGEVGLDEVYAGLELLGLRLPKNPGKFTVLREFIRSKWYLRGKTAADLVNLPVMTDEGKRIAISLLYNAFANAYQVSAELAGVVVLTMVNLSIRYGNTDDSAPGYASYGTILGQGFGALNAGYQFGDLAIALGKRFNNPFIEGRSEFIFTNHHLHWRRHLRNALEHYQHCYRLALESGDNLFASYSLAMIPLAHTALGSPLSDVSAAADQVLEFTRRTNIEYSRFYHTICSRMVLALQGATDAPTSFAGEDFDEEKFLAVVSQRQYTVPRVYYQLVKLELHLLFGEYQKAISYGHDIAVDQQGMIAQIVDAEYTFYFSLALLGGMEVVPDKKQAWLLVNSALKKMKRWAKNSPENFLHKQLLMEAEIARVRGGHAEATEQYDRAIASAGEQGYNHIKAFAQELAGRHFIATNRRNVGVSYLAEARTGYQTWGATAKVRQLEREYPELNFDKTFADQPGQWHTSDSSLDLLSVIKASQVLAGEIVLDRLLDKLMRIVIENAGAESGKLILAEQGELRVEARGRADSERVEVLRGIPMREVSDLPHSVVQYVARTGESLVLNRASSEGNFTADPYIIATQPKSILCVPIVNQGKLVGVIHLENNLATDVFTDERVEMLTILSTQLAGSIVNAKLYNDLAELNTAYERFVPHEFLELLGKRSITDVGLGDQQQREMTVLFADIRNFTSLSESMTPKENIDFINGFLKRMVPPIREHHGFIDKYIGDAIMALFPRRPDDAIEAALAMRQNLHQYNRERVERGFVPIEFGTGIHTGSLMLGIVGEAERLDSTVISDVVNVAGRIEELTKTYQTPILASGGTLAAMVEPGRFRQRHLGDVQIRGKADLVAVHEVIGYD